MPLHYSVTAADGARFYIGPTLISQARKDYEIIGLAKDALNGKLVIQNGDEPIEIYDHAWLLRFVSAATAVVAQMMEK